MGIFLVIAVWALSLYVTVQVMELAWGIELVSLWWLIGGGVMQAFLHGMLVATLSD